MSLENSILFELPDFWTGFPLSPSWIGMDSGVSKLAVTSYFNVASSVFRLDCTVCTLPGHVDLSDSATLFACDR